MNDPTLVIALIVFVVSFTIIIIRELGRARTGPVLVHAAAAPPEEHKSFTNAAVRVASSDSHLEREIDKLREEQVRLRIEIDRLKRPMGTPADG